jgi:L-asparaginase
LIVHGGAGGGRWTAARREQQRASVAAILSEVFSELKRGRSALDCVARAVVLLENDPLFNAGRGSKIQSDGHIRMSASIMDGEKRRFAGCVNVERVKNPVLLAQSLLREEDRVLSETGAQAYAKKRKLAFASAFTEEQLQSFRRQKKGKTGTVGAVALDRNGKLAAATSTGGKGGEIPHRVSDTPTVAANYATRECAVSATGIGEEIMEFAVAASICANVQSGIPVQQASRQLIRAAKKEKAEFGFIALDKSGTFSAAKSTPHMVWGVAYSDQCLIGF